jgi:probable selenium-dependent hydroxylase accessory protein YqeC
MIMLREALNLKKGDLVVFVGAGGKTSAMNRLAKELVDSGDTVIITTTTKIFPPLNLNSRLYLLENEKEGISHITFPEKPRILVLGKKINEEGKIVGLDRAQLKTIREKWPDTVILVEGDGAKGKPFKAPREYEPVIPIETTLVIPVLGVDALGQPLDEVHFHRVEEICLLTGLRRGDYLRPEDVAKILLHKKGYQKGVPAFARWIPLINKVDTLHQRGQAIELAEILKKSGVAKVLLGSMGIENSPVEVL